MRLRTRVLLFGGFVAVLTTLVISRAHKTRDSEKPRGIERDHDSGKWLTITVNRSLNEVNSDSLPKPLASFGHLIEVRWKNAPGGRGTELAARWLANMRDGFHVEDGQARLREHLRETKQLLETGHVLTVSPQPHGARPATPTGLVTDVLVRRSGGEGVL